MKKYVLILTPLMLAGCASMRPVDVAKPSEVTIQSALRDVALGLQEFRSLNIANKTNYGLLVDEVTIILKVTASAKDSSKLVVNVSDVKPAFIAPGILKSDLTFDGSSDGTRDNTITIKLKNMYTAQLNARGIGAKLTNGSDGQVKLGPFNTLSAPGAFVVDCAKPDNAIAKLICENQLKVPATPPG